MALTETQEIALAAAADHALAYRRNDHLRPLNPSSDHRAICAAIGGRLPANGGAEDQIIGELAREAESGLMVPTHPNFHGWVIGASHPAGVAADWLVSAWGQVGGVAPAISAIEEIAAGWLVELLHLPETTGVGFATGATMANFTCLAAARTALLDRVGWDVEKDGLFGAPEIRVVLGAEAHSSVYLSLRLLGFGAGRVHVVAVDDQGRMRPDALAETLNGLDGPVLVILQAGNVMTGAFDPAAQLIPLARERNAWVHIDGAFGLWALACDELSALTAGIADADSWAADAHKWLQAPYDCGLAFVADAGAQRRAMSMSASYLITSDHRQPEDYSPELSRRARGVPVWAIIRALGKSGIDEMISRHCRTARTIAAEIAAEPGLAVLNDVVLNQVLIACESDDGAAADALTEATLKAVQSSGDAYPSHGRWKGRAVIRVSVSSGPAGPEDGKRTAQAIIAAWREVREAG